MTPIPICSQTKQTNKEDVMARRKTTTPRATVKFLPKEGVYLAKCGNKSNRYGVGSVVPEGSCAYKEERGPWTARTLEDAKQMAVDFVSNMRTLAKD